MTPSPEVQERLRRYLLGQLDDDARGEVEKDLIANDQIYQELLIVEDEVVDEYLEGGLGERDRLAFEAHFLATPDRQETLRFGRAFKRYVAMHSDAGTSETSLRKKGPPKPDLRFSWRPFFSSPLAIAASALLVIGLGFGLWRVFIRQSPVDQGLQALNAAYRDQRPLEARISAIDYAPFPQTRSAGKSPPVDSLARTRAEATLTNEVNERANARAHHALGQVFLANLQFDQAIQQFDEAVKSGSSDPKLYSDLGVAWMEKGRVEPASDETGKRSVDLGHALTSFNKALELDNHSLEAVFNKALCLKLMSLPDQEEQQWRAYLKLDSSSPWAQDALRNLKKLEELKGRSEKINPVEDFLKAYQASDDEAAWRVVSRHRNSSGGPVVNSLIENYLESSKKNQGDQAQGALRTLAYLAKLENERAGDLFVQDLFHEFSRLSMPQRESMIEARRLLRLGQQNYLNANYQLAVDSLGQASDIFRQAGCPTEAILAEYPLAHSLLGQKKTEAALAAFEHVIHMSEMHRYKWLMAQALNAKANTQINLTNHSEALEASERSLAVSKEIGDSTGVIKTTNQLASEYYRLGNYGKSLSLHEQSITAANQTSTEPMQYWRNYFSMAMPLEALGLHDAAIEYEEEALRRAKDLKQDTEISRSYSLLGMMHAGAGQYQAAIENGNAAISVASMIPDERARKEAVAYSTLQLAMVYRKAGEPDKAITNYDEAQKSYRELDNFAAFSYVANKGKLLACIASPRCTTANQQIDACLDLFQQYRANIREISNKLPFFDTEQDIYDVAAEFEFDRGNYQRSFEHSEHARAQTLRELAENKGKAAGTSAHPDLEVDPLSHMMTLDEIRAALPPDAQVVQYTVLKDKLIIWLISNSVFVHEEKTIAMTDLAEIVSRYLRLVSSASSSNDDLRRDGSALFEILIKPVAQRLMKDKLLCIVPDKMLAYLPFASLIPAPGEYLIDEFRIMTAPSSAMFITSSAVASNKSQVETETLLSVGNPQFNRAQFPQLADLPSAAKEAQDIKRFYEQAPGPFVLIGEQATKSMVTAQMRQAVVIHLASHSIVDELSPLRSRLILADANQGGADATGVLEAYEIYETPMSSARLVVLSACDTNTGRYYRGEGILGLAGTFMAAGVPLVVATLWSVDSDASAELMTEFHRLRKTERLATVEALRRAQLSMAHGPDTQYSQPYYWAGFTTSGGYATF